VVPVHVGHAVPDPAVDPPVPEPPGHPGHVGHVPQSLGTHPTQRGHVSQYVVHPGHVGHVEQSVGQPEAFGVSVQFEHPGHEGHVEQFWHPGDVGDTTQYEQREQPEEVMQVASLQYSVQIWQYLNLKGI